MPRTIRLTALCLLLPVLAGVVHAAGPGEHAPQTWDMQAAVDRLFPDGPPRDSQALRAALQAAAGNGDADAQLLLALALEDTGRQRSAEWMRKAAEQGHPAALTGMARLAFEAGATSEGVDWSRRAADSGDAEAQYAFGLMQLNGEGMQADAAAAVHWFTRAAAQGHPGAQEQLAAAYWNGRGIAEDQDEAYFWLLLAADKRTKARDFLQSAAAWIGPDRVAAAEQRAQAWVPAVDRADGAN